MAKGRGQKPTDDGAMRQAQRILDRVEQDSETVSMNSVSRALDAFKKRVDGDETEQNDPVEIMGRRIGRTLGWVFMIGLAIYLVFTYIL